MTHPKMKYTYVGIDSHKQTHTAVFLDCFFEKLGEITFDNLPTAFDAFLNDAQKFQSDGTTLLFGLEDTSHYGRSLTIFLQKNNQPVKHVNAYLVARERKNQSAVQKSDSIDAECAARVLLSKFSEIPYANINDEYWILRTLVVRRDFLVRNNKALKNQLHSLLSLHYPSYTKYFYTIDGKAALAFFMFYPSPGTLKDISAEELADFLYEQSQGKYGIDKAVEILDSIKDIIKNDISAPFQDIRDLAVQSVLRQFKFNLEEVERLEMTLAKVYSRFNVTLTSMNGIDLVSAAQILSCIGDIKKFPTSAKLARYAGIAPVSYSSGKKDSQYATLSGNRELNSLIYKLAVRLISNIGSDSKAMNLFFYNYYNRKISEGKTKRQSLKCVQRRLINIIWGMLRNCEDYVNPPMIQVPKKKKDRLPSHELR